MNTHRHGMPAKAAITGSVGLNIKVANSRRALIRLAQVAVECTEAGALRWTSEQAIY